MTSVARRTDDSGEFSEGSQEIDHSNSGNEGDPVDSDYDTPGDISDSENPENQEPGTERRVDDDEDRSNPQYIPKRGTFYEHDDRTADNGEETTNTTSELSAEKEGSEPGGERRRPPRKSDVINKWSHDKFNENEQMPKSRDELVSIYGYDIRNEEAPPHARRNRRYGRGPNKYTRTWEDEEAYKRQTAAQAQPRKPPNPEDFPELDASRRHPRRPRTLRPRSQSQPESNDSTASSTPIRRNASTRSPKHRPSPAIKTGVRATVRTPLARPSRPRDVDARNRGGESGDVRNRGGVSGDVRNRGGVSGDVRNRGGESGDVRNRGGESGDVRNRGGESGDVRNRGGESGDVRNRGGESGDVRNRGGESGDVRNRGGESGDVRNRSRESGDVRNRDSDSKSGDGDARREERIVRESGDVRREQRDRKLKMPQIENLSIAVNNSEGEPQRKVLGSVAQQRPVPTEHAKKKPSPQGPPLNVSQSKPQPPQQQQKSQSAPSAESRGGSKRYSSLRQRPLADPAYTQQQPQQLPQVPQQLPQVPQQLPQVPQQLPQQLPQGQLQQQPQQHRYATPPGGGEFAAGNAGLNPPQHPQQHIMHQVVRNTSAPHSSSPPHQLPPPQTAKYEDSKYEVRLGLLEQQQLVQHQLQAQQQQAQHSNKQHAMHNMPQQHAIGQMQPPLQPTQGYAPPAMMPAQYMQSGSQQVYGGAPMYASPPAPYTHPQIYPHHNYVASAHGLQAAQAQATQAGGVTYFRCAEQDGPRAPRRPTAAIPIVRPAQPAQPDRPANSIEKDNIDRIVENMFVRKPWPATHGAESKEKSQCERSSQEPTPKDLSQPNSLTSSSISTDSKPSESIDKDDSKDTNVLENTEIAEKPIEQVPEAEATEEPAQAAPHESIPADA